MLRTDTSLLLVLAFIISFSRDQFKMNDMGVECGNWQTEGVHAGVLLVYPEGKNHLENLGVDGNIILKWIFKTWDWKR